MRSVIITGVSQGLGAALMDEVYRQGDRVVAVGRRFTAHQHALASADQDRVSLLEADLSDPAALPSVETLSTLLGDRVAVVHNAGLIGPIGALGSLEPDRIAGTVAVNLLAPMLLTNTVLAACPGVQDLRILFVSSGAAYRVKEGLATYCATKAGGEMFFRALAAQVADDSRYDVRVVDPGIMDTGMQATIRSAPTGYLPERPRYVDMYERGEIPGPGLVARRIVAEHLRD